MVKIISLSLLLGISSFIFYASNEIIAETKNHHAEVFETKLEPIDYVLECTQGHPRDGAECEEEPIYSEEDQAIIDHRNDLLFPYPFLEIVALITMIISGLWLIRSIYVSISESRSQNICQRELAEKKRLALTDPQIAAQLEHKEMWERIQKRIKPEKEKELTFGKVFIYGFIILNIFATTVTVAIDFFDGTNDYDSNDSEEDVYFEDEDYYDEEYEDVYYVNCDDARDQGAAPVYEGDPGYASHLDRDGDGVGCEPY